MTDVRESAPESPVKPTSDQPTTVVPKEVEIADQGEQGVATQAAIPSEIGILPPSTTEIQEKDMRLPVAPTDGQVALKDRLPLLKRREAQLGRKKLPLLFSDLPRSVAETKGVEPKQPVDRIAFVFGPQLGGFHVASTSERAAKSTALGGIFAQMEWKRLLLSVEPTLAFIRADQGSLSTADTSFAFGYTITTEQLRWNDQLEWQIPVLLGLRLGERHQLFAGPVFHQYISSAYSFERTRDIQGQGTAVLAQENGRGQVPGLEVIPPSMLFRYQFRLNDAFGLGMQYQSAPPSSTRLHWQIQLRYQLINIR
jgi:hypothetical protein